MKNYFLALFLLLYSISSFSQHGIISGNIIDATTKQPVEFATIAVLSQKDSSIVTGTISQDGNFQINNLSNGNFILQITFIGYETKRLNFIISSNKSKVTFNNLKLNVSR